MISEAFPPNSTKAKLISNVHEFLSTGDFELDENSVEFEFKIDHTNREEIENLHKEWFPVDYSPAFFDRIEREEIKVVVATGSVTVKEKVPIISQHEKISITATKHPTTTNFCLFCFLMIH